MVQPPQADDAGFGPKFRKPSLGGTMQRYRTTILASLAATCLLGTIPCFGANGDKAEAKGMIMSRTGETLIVSGPQGKVTVVLTDDTRTKDDKGLFGLEKEQMSNVVLIPGLKVDVDGASDDQGRLVAK